MAMVLRFATARDIAAIARVCVESLPDDPTFDYLWHYRQQYPEHNYFFWLQRLKAHLFDPKMTCLVVTKPHYRGVEETVIAFGPWQRQGSTKSARYWQKQSWLAWIKNVTTSIENWAITQQYQRRDADPLRVEAFKKVMDEVYNAYWRKAYPDNWHLELLFTHPDHRKQGAATKPIQWAPSRMLRRKVLTWDLKVVLWASPVPESRVQPDRAASCQGER